MSNKKLIFSFILLSISLNIIVAKTEVGLSFGLNKNYLEYDSGIYSNRTYDSALGISIAVPVKYEINDYFALQGEINYLQKNYISETYQIYDGSTTYAKYVNSYFELPLMAHLYVSPPTYNLRGFFNLGGYFGIWGGKNATGSFYDLFAAYSYTDDYPITSEYSGSLEFNDGDRRFDLGLLGGTGLELKLDQKLTASMEFRYLYSFFGMYKNYQYNLYNKYNYTYNLQLALMYEL